MKWIKRWQRIFFLCLLSVSVFAPMVLISYRLKPLTSEGTKEFVQDLPSIIHGANVLSLNAVGQEAKEGLKEPNPEVYRDQNYSVVSHSESKDGSKEVRRVGGSRVMSESEDNATKPGFKEEIKPNRPREDLSRTKIKDPNQNHSQDSHDVRTPHMTTVPRGQRIPTVRRRMTDEKVKQIRDQVIRAKAYLSFATASGNSHLVKELRLRIKEVERALGEARRDSELSRSALQKMKAMESTLSKAAHAYPDCSNMVNRLRAMTHNAEDQVQLQRNQATFLTELAGRTTPKGIHCLSMRLTTEYFTLQPERQALPNQQNVYNPNLRHFVVFSDNILAAAVVVNSTVSNAGEPEKIVFHVVTDSLNFPAISMWFWLNPPGKATIQVLSVNDFQWLSAEYVASLEKQNSRDPRYSSLLNHLRFFLPQMFPQLDKIVFLDHDVVVQRDLSSLWIVDLKGKVNGAVETCKYVESSYRRMDMLINFSDPLVSSKFDASACTWAFGLNLFDLRLWRAQDLTSSYHRLLSMGNERPLWSAGSLPLGWLTFYDQTMPLDRRWHLLGLGYDSQLRTDDIERAAAIHYDGIMKPWLDVGIKKYKGYWNKYVDYDHPYLQRCNLHG